MIGILDTMGGFISLKEIKSAKAYTNEHKVEMYNLTLRGGERAELYGGAWHMLQLRPVQLIPAEPGISFLHAWADGDDPAEWSYGRTPLIGWALCFDGEVRPVTPSGVNDGCGENDGMGNFVEMPNGKVVSVSSWADRASYDDVDHFFADFLARCGKIRPEKAA